MSLKFVDVSGYSPAPTPAPTLPLSEPFSASTTPPPFNYFNEEYFKYNEKMEPLCVMYPNKNFCKYNVSESENWKDVDNTILKQTQENDEQAKKIKNVYYNISSENIAPIGIPSRINFKIKDIKDKWYPTQNVRRANDSIDRKYALSVAEINNGNEIKSRNNKDIKVHADNKKFKYEINKLKNKLEKESKGWACGDYHKDKFILPKNDINETVSIPIKDLNYFRDNRYVSTNDYTKYLFFTKPLMENRKIQSPQCSPTQLKYIWNHNRFSDYFSVDEKSVVNNKVNKINFRQDDQFGGFKNLQLFLNKPPLEYPKSDYSLSLDRNSALCESNINNSSKKYNNLCCPIDLN